MSTHNSLFLIYLMKTAQHHMAFKGKLRKKNIFSYFFPDV